MKPFWACKGPESKTFSPMNISFDSRCNDIAEIPHEDTVEASNVNDAEMSSSDDADMPNSETPNRNDAAASNDVTAEMPMSNDTTIHIDSSAEVPNSDAEVPSNVQAPSVEKPNPRCLTLAASKTFLEEDEEDEEEPVVEVNISTSGDAIICGDALTAVVETRQPSRWNALRKSRPSRQQWARKLPTTLPAWSRDIPKSLNGWTRREKILLFIAILNTLIIVALLGSNMAILKQKTRTQTQLSAMSKSESSIECGNGPIAGGESGGKGSGGKKKKDSEGEGTANEGGNPETDPVVADDEVEADDDGSNSGDMWTVSTNTSLAGGQPAQNNSNSTSNNSNGTGTNTNGGNSDAPIDNGNGGVDNSDGSTAPPNDTGDDTGDGGEAEPLGDPDSLCGCPSCTESIWNQVAEQATCGDRITFLQEDQPLRFPTEVHACRQIAFEFPCICGGCDPGRCNIPTNEFLLPDSWKPSTTDKFAQIITPAPTPVTATTAASIVQENQVLYCYPDPSARISYTLWGGMVVQVKEDLNVCGPGNNMFSNENVVVDEQADTLTLVYTEGQAAEVRILLPQESRPFSYGSYSFSVQSVEVKDVTGAIKSTILPKELILGLFTWDDTESYAVHENFNHEVDIEISRWNCEDNSDLQFLVQPPGFPQMHRLFTGDASSTNAEEKYKQGGQVYEFLWNPAQIDWTTTAGSGNNEFSLKSEEAVFRNVPDYIQCLPDRGGNMEVRINLWNFLGANTPSNLVASDRVEVVIDNFSFTPSSVTFVPDGGVCTKHCHCNMDASKCVHNVCSPK